MTSPAARFLLFALSRLALDLVALVAAVGSLIHLLSSLGPLHFASLAVGTVAASYLRRRSSR